MSSCHVQVEPCDCNLKYIDLQGVHHTSQKKTSSPCTWFIVVAKLTRFQKLYKMGHYYEWTL